MLKNVLSIVIALVLLAVGYFQLNDTEAEKSGNANPSNQSTQEGPRNPARSGGDPSGTKSEKPGPNLAGNTLNREGQPGSQPAKSEPDTGAAKIPPRKPAETPAPKRGPPAQAAPAQTTPSKSSPAREAAKKPGSNRVVVTLRGGHKEDITETLARIKRGEKHSHRNDGSVFGNYERRLPRKQRGYYREYVHPTPGIRHAGARRVVIGKGGEIYYTHDHYKTFTKVQAQ